MRNVLLALLLCASGCRRPSGSDPDGGCCGDERVAYTSWEGCDFEGCLADRVSSCEPVEALYYWDYGSEGLRLCAREGPTCVIAAFSEVEGGLESYLCRVPRSLGAWPSLTAGGGKMLDDVRAYCEPRVQCNVLFRNCPPDVLECPAP